jgi:RNA polymerase sigma-70 factor (ECF subfamily)
MTRRALKTVSSKVAEQQADRWDWVAARAHCLREARRILGRTAAEDAAQEALLRAWRRGLSGAAVENRMAWLTRVARNEALRLHAREAALERRRAEAGTLTLGAVPDEETTPLVERISLSPLIAALAPRDRQLLRLRYLEDLTQAEIAHRLGIPEGTAKVRLHRVRRRLEEQLREVW